MSAGWDARALLDPIAGEQPCGQNPDVAGLLGPFDALRLFGQPRSPEAPPEEDEGDKEAAKAKPPIEWEKIRDQAIESLAKSKDLRLLAYLGTAVLRTDGLPAFNQTLTTAAQWLDSYWPQVYPPLDEDALERRNALNCFADPMAVVDRVWRLPLVTSRQHGRYSLRDIDIARGQSMPGALEAKPEESSIRLAFKELASEELTALERSITEGIAALNRIDTRMRSEGGPDMAPDFGPLLTHLAKLAKVYQEELATRVETGTGATVGVDGQPVAAATFSGGVINSRADAIRALDAVGEYFRRSEPSSPIPLFVDRAKRLVAKDFLEVLADIAPEAVTVAKSAGGLKDQ
jgi:type VI secretion system protein ImpA